MLAAGDRLPNVRVFAAPGEGLTLDDAAAGAKTLFLFYLFDFSATWTNEMEVLRDRAREFEEAGVRVFGISRDSPWTHIAWSQVLDLSFPLLSDWNGDATRAFGVTTRFRDLEGVSGRSAFLVDAGGTVRGAWRYDPGDVPDFDELLAAARAL